MHCLDGNIIGSSHKTTYAVSFMDITHCFHDVGGFLKLITRPYRRTSSQ